MNATTENLLRNAVIEAVNNRENTAAMELLAILIGDQPSQTVPQPALVALPANRQVIDGPAHDYHYWAGFIRENFIPFMLTNGRLRFTSRELFTWLENCQSVCMTTGDIEVRPDGSESWRSIVSHSLSALKDRGIIEAPAKSRIYRIQDQLILGQVA